VLRSSDLAACTASGDFVARLQHRLREEPAFSASQAVAPAMAIPTAAPQAEAANDGSFRWKVVAGAASFAAVSAIAWTLMGAAPAREGSQIAASREAGPTVLTSSERGVMIRDPRLDEFMSAHRQLGGATLVAPAGYLRNATFDAPAR
jgi:sigma-E factor negative regulatory protein RseA